MLGFIFFSILPVVIVAVTAFVRAILLVFSHTCLHVLLGEFYFVFKKEFLWAENV